jgi:predicted molibdopterin-dependent oxidoreductase YjgC
MPGEFQVPPAKYEPEPRQENVPMFFWLNGQKVQGNAGQTLMEAISPHCALPGLCGESIPDLDGPCLRCGLCVIEVDGQEKLAHACTTPLEEGMEIRTFSRAVRRARTLALMDLANRHKGNCLLCDRSGHCRLQQICADQGLALLSQPRPNPEFTLVPANGQPEEIEAGRRLADLSLVARPVRPIGDYEPQCHPSV